jgi:hypothetical protein
MEFPEGSPERVPGVLIAFKPTLVMDGFRALDADKAKIIGQAIKESPGAPDLTIVRIEQPDPQDIAEMEETPVPSDAPAPAPSDTGVAEGQPTSTAVQSDTPIAANPEGGGDPSGRGRGKPDRTALLKAAVAKGKAKKAVKKKK